MFACRKCGFGRGFGWAIRAAHQFDENIHVIAGRQFDGIIFPIIRRQRQPAVLVAGAGRDRRNRHRAAGAGL